MVAFLQVGESRLAGTRLTAHLLQSRSDLAADLWCLAEASVRSPTEKARSAGAVAPGAVLQGRAPASPLSCVFAVASK